jgi:hypothetical protein
MEFEEMQRVWDSQTNQPLYAINETALHNRIISKKEKARHITNISELLVIIVNAGMGSFILALNFFKQSTNIFLYLMAIWMFGSALYLLVSRIRRISGGKRFDRSMRGDLDHAVSVATYQVRLSLLMRWNILPMGILVLLSVWEGNKSVWIIVLILAFFAIVHFASAWEHNIYRSRKRELEALRNKLESEKPGSGHSSV